MRSFATATLLVTIALAGCGGDSGSPSPEPGAVPQEEAYLPLAVGNKWVYEIRELHIKPAQSGEQFPDHYTYRITGTQTIDGQEWYVLEVVAWKSQQGEGKPLDTSYNFVRETASGLYKYEYDQPRGRPVLWLAKPPEQGLKFSGLLNLEWEVVQTSETVVVPYGTIRGCVRIEGQEKTAEQWRYWFKKGLGLVAYQWVGSEVDADEHALVECHLVP